MITDKKIPAGFAPHFRKSSLTDPWEPLYSKTEPDRVRIGVFLSSAHCNSRELVHGGLIAALSDNAMGLSCAAVLKSQDRPPKGLLTISLQTDFMGMAKIGQWLDIDTDYVKCGGSICFARAIIRADGDPIAKANASFKIL